MKPQSTSKNFAVKRGHYTMRLRGIALRVLATHDEALALLRALETARRAA